MELGRRGRLLNLLRGQVLFVAGEPAVAMFVIVSGCLHATRVSAEGREQVIHVERAGATMAEVPMFDEEAYPSTVTADEDSVVISLRRSDVRASCLEHPEIAMAALKILAGRLRRCAVLVESLSLRNVDCRLAMFLQSLADDAGKQPGSTAGFELRFTHQQIAARIGSVREVISRAMGRLQKSGLIAVNGNRVVVPSRTAIADYVAGKTSGKRSLPSSQRR